MTTPIDDVGSPETSGAASEDLVEGVGGAEDLPIRRVETVSGLVTVVRVDGTQETLEPGMPVHQGDTVETGEGGSLGVVLADDTTFFMSGNGTMVLDEMVYDPATLEGSISLSVTEAGGDTASTAAATAEYNPVGLEIEADLAEVAGDEATIAVTIMGVPEGAVLSGREALTPSPSTTLGQGEDLPRKDEVRIADLVLVGVVDHRVGKAAAVGASG
jgi:hypothetical protein